MKLIAGYRNIRNMLKKLQAYLLPVLRPLLSAISFLTVIPVPSFVHRDQDALASAPACYPLVGIVIGLVVALTASLPIPPALMVLLLAAVPFVLTRGMHADGLADTADGLLGGKTPEERSRIMHDPRVGTFGVLAIAFDVVARVALITAIGGRNATAALIASPVMGRWAMVVAMSLVPYDPKGGLKAAAGKPGWRNAAIALAVVVIISVWNRPFSDILLLATLGVAALAALWAWLVRKMLGHMSGDALGALNEMVELLTFALFLDWNY